MQWIGVLALINGMMTGVWLMWSTVT